MNSRQIMRGDMFYANLNPTIGSEQGDTRPVLVVQNNAGNTHSPTVVVVPITRTSTRKQCQPMCCSRSQPGLIQNRWLW